MLLFILCYVINQQTIVSSGIKTPNVKLFTEMMLGLSLSQPSGPSVLRSYCLPSAIDWIRLPVSLTCLENMATPSTEVQTVPVKKPAGKCCGSLTNVQHIRTFLLGCRSLCQ